MRYVQIPGQNVRRPILCFSFLDSNGNTAPLVLQIYMHVSGVTENFEMFKVMARNLLALDNC